MALSDNLVAYYSMEEASGTRVDATGRGNDLNLNANTPGNAAGIQSNGLSVATNQSVSVTDKADLSIGTRDYEILFWFKPSVLSGSKRLISKDDAGSNREYVIRTNGTKIETFVWSNTVLAGVFQLTTTLSTGTWYMVDWFYTSATKTVSLSVNLGTPVTGTTSQTKIDDLAAPFVVGGDNTEFCSAVIDELGVWSRNLTGAERTDLYNAGAGRTYSYITTPAGGLLVNPGMDGGMKQMTGGIRG